MAEHGARIARVDIGVDEAVERHGRRARPDHRHHDPGDFAPEEIARKTALADRQQRAGQRKGQREEGVLELDHFEREAESIPHSSGYFSSMK